MGTKLVLTGLVIGLLLPPLFTALGLGVLATPFILTGAIIGIIGLLVLWLRE